MRDDDDAATCRVETAIPQERSKSDQCNFIVPRVSSNVDEAGDSLLNSSAASKMPRGTRKNNF